MSNSRSAAAQEAAEALRASSATSLAEEVRKFKRDMLARRNIRVERVDRDWFPADSSNQPSSMENTPRATLPVSSHHHRNAPLTTHTRSPSPPSHSRRPTDKERLIERRISPQVKQFSPTQVVVHCPCIRRCPCSNAGSVQTRQPVASSAPCSARPPRRSQSPEMRDPLGPRQVYQAPRPQATSGPRMRQSVGVQTVFVQSKVGELEREVARLRRENVRLTAVANRLRWEAAAAGSARGVANTRFFTVI